MLERRNHESDISELRNVFWLSAHCLDDVEPLDTPSLQYVPAALWGTATLVLLACTILSMNALPVHLLRQVSLLGAFKSF